jgi:hypothetical protein
MAEFYREPTAFGSDELIRVLNGCGSLDHAQ